MPSGPDVSDGNIKAIAWEVEDSFRCTTEGPAERAENLGIVCGTHFIKLRRSLGGATLFATDFGVSGDNQLPVREAVLRSGDKVRHFVYEMHSWEFMLREAVLKLLPQSDSSDPKIEYDRTMPPALLAANPGSFTTLIRASGEDYDAAVAVRKSHLDLMTTPEAAQQFVWDTAAFADPENIEYRTTPTVRPVVYSNFL